MLERRGLDGLLHVPLRAVVGNELTVLLARAERAHEHEAPRATSLGGCDEVARALRHHPLELFGPTLDHRHQVDDALDALGCGAETGGVRHVALDELAAPGLEGLRPAAVADERSDGVVAGSQCVHDLRADEPVAAGDEDLHFCSPSKLRQYALGVGPFWPWYFEPRPAEP